MNNIREKFTANAEEFDSLMVEMLTRNAQLEEALSRIATLYDDATTVSMQAQSMYDASCIAKQILE